MYNNLDRKAERKIRQGIEKVYALLFLNYVKANPQSLKGTYDQRTKCHLNNFSWSYNNQWTFYVGTILYFPTTVLFETDTAVSF